MKRVLSSHYFLYLLYVVIAGVFFLGSHVTHAVTYTWDAVSGNGVNDDGSGVWNTTSTLWTTDNGISNVLWVDANDVIIGSGAGAAGTITVGGTGTQTVNSITFNAPISGTYVISGGTIALGAALTNLTASNNATINSVLGSTGGLNKLNASTLTLTATNTYTGATVLTGGVLSINKLQNGLTNSSLGSSSNAASNLRFVGGNLTYTGIAASTDRLFTLSNNGTITQNGSGVISFTNTGALAHTATSTNRTLTLSGTQTGANSFAPLITNANPALTSVSKTAAGRWDLTNINTYTGITTFGGGTLAITTLGDGGVAGNIGAATSGPANLVFNTGILLYSGVATSSNRGMTFTGAGTINTTNALTLSGSLVGAGALTKAGAGTLTLTGTNTRTGATTMNAGTVSVATIGNGSVASNLSAASNASANIAFTGGTLQYTGITSSTNRGMTFTSTGTIDVVSATLTVSGVIAGAGQFNKTGTGAMVMTGANTRTGILNITAGTVSVSTISPGGFTSALGAATAASTNIVLAGGTFQYTGSSTTTDRGLTISSPSVIDITTNTLTTNGVLTGSGSWSKNGNGILALSGVNTFTGALSLNQGILSLNSVSNGGVSSALGAATAASSNIVFNGGTLQYTGSSASIDRGATLTSTAVIDVTTNTLSTSGVFTGAGGVTKIGNGVLTLSGANTYTGITTFSTGTVSVATIANGGVASPLGAASAASSNLVFNGGSLQFSGATASTDRGATLMSASTGTIDITTNTLTTTGVITGAGHLVKTGAGILVLSGVNTYSGNTWVNAGELRVDGSLSTGPVRVNLATLSGTGTIGGAVTLTNSAGSKLQGGTGSGNAGTLTTGAVQFGGVLSKLQVNTNGVTPSKIISTGAVALNGMTVDINGVLPDGTYDLINAASISGSAVIGNYSTGASGSQNQLVVTATKLQLIVDTTPDAAPGLADLQTSSDTGYSTSDNYTSDTTPSFDLSCVTSSTVNLYSTSTLLGSGVCTSGTVTITTGVLSDGVYNAIQSTQVDTAGNSSVTSTPLSVTIDTTSDAAPGTPDLQTSSDTGSSSSDDITNIATPTFDIACITGDLVELYSGATLLASSFCSGGTVSITTSALPDGIYSQIKARQVDLANNSSTFSSTLTIEIDTSAFSAPGAPDVQASSDTGDSLTDNITSQNTPTFDISCVSGAVVKLYSTSTLLGTGVCSAGTVSITTSLLVDGVYSSIQATQTDTAGNNSPTSSSVLIEIDTIADGVTGTPDLQTGSDSGSSSSDDLTNYSTPVFDISCATGSTVRLFSTSTLIGSAVCVGGSISVTSSLLTDGVYNAIQSIQTDVAGNSSVTSSPLSITIDTLSDSAPGAPDLIASSDTGSLSTDDITNDTTPTYDISCVTNSEVELYRGAVFMSSSTCIGGMVSLTTPVLADGIYTTIKARQVDQAGNASSFSALVTTEIDSASDAAPSAPDLVTLSDTGASSTDNITSDSTPSFTISCSSGSEVVLWDGITTFTTGTCSGALITLTPTFADGTYTLSAYQTDIAGNNSSDSVPLVVVIVDTIPSGSTGAPDLDPSSDTGSSSSDNLTNDTTPTFNISCSTGDTVMLYSTSTLIGTATCTAGIATITSSVLSEGVYQALHAVQEDIAGNRSATSTDLSLTIDTTAPTVTLNQGAGQPDPTNNATSTFRIVFNESIQTSLFASSDIGFTGSTVSSTAVLSLTEVAPMDGTTFDVVVTSTGIGVVQASVLVNAVQDFAGNSSLGSTSVDQSVTHSPFTASAPVSLSSTPGNGQVALSWGVPVSNGGSSITNYLIQYRQTGAPTFTTYSHPTSTATSITVTGLTNGISYEFQVAAKTSAGTGAFSNLSSATPVAPVVVVSSGGGGGGGGGSYTPPTIAPDTGDVERVKAMTTLGYEIHDLVKLPDDGNPKTQEDSAVYYLAADGRRHAFPDPRVFASWYCDFSKVEIIPLAKIAQIPLGKNVTHRPGLRLVKFPTNPKVYLVQMGRVLREISSEQQAQTLLGSDWAKKVSDIADTFYLDYSFGAPLSDTEVKPLLDQSSSFISGEFMITGYTDERVVNVSSLSCAGAVIPATTKTWPYKELQPGFRFTNTLSPGEEITQENRALQELLASLGKDIYPEAQITGKYGAFTAAAVGRFQASKGLSPTSIVGPGTRAELNKIIASKE